MKIIFLDVDGVLNSQNTNARTPNGYVGIQDKLVRQLKKIVNATGAKVVLSSDWRLMGRNEPDYKYLVNKLYYKGHIKIFSKTPDYKWQWRGREIGGWLEDHEVDNYVVLDDIYFDDFCPRHNGHVVMTDYHFGLRDEDVEKAIKILNGENV